LFRVLEREMGTISLQDIIDGRLPEQLKDPEQTTQLHR
jgi:hypothetical protein